eukprot:TRINITY_DN36842_c0_g1_i1.p1 TRINITY_DN36842_c0_g1~~TRINITY_DN36842_c0_g1_i1.p1  ORF type:complete len:271 (+),score=43.40 TRINITY_DN36842_c0_g1_i1:63-815(+)
MGTGASVDVAAQIKAASDDEKKALIEGLSQDVRDRLFAALEEATKQDSTKSTDGVSVSIVLVSGEALLPAFQVQPSALISLLKKKAEEALGRPIRSLASSSGEALDNNSTVAESGLKEGVCITAVVAPDALDFTFQASDYNPVGIEESWCVRVVARADEAPSTDATATTGGKGMEALMSTLNGLFRCTMEEGNGEDKKRFMDFLQSASECTYIVNRDNRIPGSAGDFSFSATAWFADHVVHLSYTMDDCS